MDTHTLALTKAAKLPQGERILALVTSERVRRSLTWAAEAGEAPVGSIAAELIASFPAEMQDLRVRQMVGLAVRSVLLAAGYEIARPRRRIPAAAPFQFGATFRKTSPPQGEDLVNRLVSALDDGEAERAYALLKARLGHR